jgi:tetratricopeptide (TPR) repeat protein
VVTNRLYAAAEESYRFGIRERPFYYAHDACRFAGRPGFPDRALVFSLLQAGVYDFHNAPARRPFIDGRLEVASREVFERNVRIHGLLTLGDPRWAKVVGRMGDPPILVDHQDNAAAEATLLADPAWRCVYSDPVAAVFLPRARDDLGRAFPTVDFAARHFRGEPARDAAAAGAEARALVQVTSLLAHRPAPLWPVRVPITLLAMDRAREAVAGGSGAWATLGHATLGLATTNAGPTRPWDPALDLPWAQAMSAYREALLRDPADGSTMKSLQASFALREMRDAPLFPDTDPPSWPGDDRLPAALDGLLAQGRPAAAVALAAEARRRGRALPWASAEGVACALLHLGEPSRARRAWREASAPPSAALLAARLADADLASWDFAAAAAGYRRALALDPGLPDAWLGLALAALEQGDAPAAIRASSRALTLPASPDRRALLEGLGALAAPYSH